ncbi:hypothetical protein ACTA71_012065 [Dictyostelium dimigraforme]
MVILFGFNDYPLVLSLVKTIIPQNIILKANADVNGIIEKKILIFLNKEDFDYLETLLNDRTQFKKKKPSSYILKIYPPSQQQDDTNIVTKFIHHHHNNYCSKISTTCFRFFTTNNNNSND